MLFVRRTSHGLGTNTLRPKDDLTTAIIALRDVLA